MQGFSTLLHLKIRVGAPENGWDLPQITMFYRIITTYVLLIPVLFKYITMTTDQYFILNIL